MSTDETKKTPGSLNWTESQHRKFEVLSDLSTEFPDHVQVELLDLFEGHIVPHARITSQSPIDRTAFRNYVQHELNKVS